MKCALCLFLGSALVLSAAAPLPLPVPRKVDFAREVWPIFKESCIKCHGPEKQKGKYRLDSRDAALKGKEGPNIIPGNSEKSPLVRMVAGLVDEGLMPPPSDKPGESEPLTKEQIGVLRAWIDQGAEWPAGEIAEVKREVTFADVTPVLKASCAECHSGSGAKGGFSVESRDAVLQGGKTYGKAAFPGNAAKSPLVIIAAGKDEDIALPEKHKLKAKDLKLLTEWIEQGAK